MMRPSALSRSSAARLLGLVLSISSPALGQGNPPGDDSDSSAEPEETTPEEEGKKEGADEKEGDREKDARAPESSALPEPAAAPVTSTQPPERQRAVALVGVEHLGGEAYPEPVTRGIHGGSLWLTMPGTQWPYMPKMEGEPAARLGLSGSAWVDMSYARTNSGLPATEYNTIVWEQQSRLVFRATPTYSTGSGWFAQAQGELVLNGTAPALEANRFATDDLYIRAGKWNAFDLTVGRFQGWEIYHFGMALDQNTYERVGPLPAQGTASPAQIYGVTHFWDRPNGPGNIALHLYGPPPVEFLRAELLGQLGNSSGQVRLAGRGTLIADWGMDLPGKNGYRLSVKAKVGGEYGDDRRTEWTEDFEHRPPTARDKVVRQGFGAALQFVFDPFVELGGSFAQGLEDRWDGRGQYIYAGSRTTTSVGGFLNVQPVTRLIFGLGAHVTDQESLRCTETTPPVPPNMAPTTEDCSRAPTAEGQFDSWKLTQYFFVAQYEPLPNLYTKLVLAHGKADYNRYSEGLAPYSHETGELFGLPLDATARLRFMYLF
jgi:hypothetical protein